MAEDTTTTTTVDEAPAAEEAPAKSTKKKGKRSVPQGQVHIQATFNNTIITVTDSKGQSLTASSAGACGFRFGRFPTPTNETCVWSRKARTCEGRQSPLSAPNPRPPENPAPPSICS